MGMEALALTDNTNLYGAIEFYKECKKKNIKPLIGIDAYLAVRKRTDKQAGIDNKRNRLVLIAKNIEGYKNLIQLVTLAHLEGFYYKPRIDDDLLSRFGQNLIAIVPSFSSATTNGIKRGAMDDSIKQIEKYKNFFEKDNVYLEVNHHPEIEGHTSLIENIFKLSAKTSTPTVATHDVYYIDPEDREARNTLVSIQTNADYSEIRDWNSDEEDFSFRSGEEIERFFKDHKESVAATFEIADKCDLDLSLGKWVFPNYVVRSGRSYDQELKYLVHEGLKKRALKETPEIRERIEHELSVIFSKGYSPYFLVVYDLLKYAHENDILTTIRGSVAGSMVTYLAGITNVNPIEYKLPFERFLNPDRPSAPDIDMDFADNRREEMIDYAKRKYGADKVAQIGTFGTMMARGAVRDVARAMGYEYSIGDRIAKIIPFGQQGFPMTIDRALEIVPEFKAAYKRDADTKKIIAMAKKIEGCARHISVHAAGVVISPTSLVDYVPLQFDPKGEGKVITQYDMYAIEEAGLLKFDFLGIRNLSILSGAVDLVKALYNADVDIEKIRLDDEKTFKLLASGQTAGLFQLNGTGMTNYLKQLKPTSIFDINAMVALYRPGPIDLIPTYIERKHNNKLVWYLDPRMKDILDQSYGVITYQDDVLLIAIKLGGFSWLEADKLRKAMGKKIPEEMEAQREKLISGFISNGMSKEIAEKLWRLIEPFAAYGFNKAHAASYGRVAYQTAYMKANFPTAYMCSVLSAESGDVEKIAEIISECKRMNIPVLPPDINESSATFTVIRENNPPEKVGGEKIRFGLTTIKNFGEGISNVIIDERKNGKFASLADFLSRIKDRNLNRKSLEALIKCGALDQFSERGKMLSNIDLLLSFNKQKKSDAPDAQNSLFADFAGSLPALNLAEGSQASFDDKLMWERELLGLYVSGHPLEKFKKSLLKVDITINDARQHMKEGMVTAVLGIIEELRDILTKREERMMFMKIADLTGSIEVVVFPKIYNQYKTLLELNKCVAVRGRISHRNGSISLVAEKFKSLA